MEAVKFNNVAAQGDCYITRVASLPESAKLVQPVDGVYLIAESETHHHHVVDAHPNVRRYLTDDPMVSYLEVIEATDATETLLRHLRSFDTHKTIVIPPGVFELRRQREYTPEGWRRVED